jgi:hypothetical protein
MSCSSNGAECNLNWFYNNFLHDKFPFNPRLDMRPSMQVEENMVDHFWAILWQIKTMLEK